MATRIKKIIILITFLVLLVMVVLPSIISSNPFRNFVLTSINSRIHGTLSIEDISIGWSKGLVVQKIQYKDTRTGFEAEIPQITGNHSFLKFVIFPKNIGTITLKNPKFLTHHKPKSKPTDIKQDISQPSRKQSTPNSDSTETSSSSSEKSHSKAAIWNGIILHLMIENGSVSFAKPDNSSQLLLKNLNWDSVLSRGTINFTGNSQSWDSLGNIGVKGFLNLPARQDTLKDTTVTEIELAISKFPIQQLLEQGSSITRIPIGKGFINTFLKVSTVGIHDININGEFSLDSAQLMGGFLEEKDVYVKKLRIGLDAHGKNPRDWVIEKLNIESESGNIQAKGRYSPGITQISGAGNISLPVLQQQIPQIFNTDNGSSIQTGNVDFIIDLNRKLGQTTLLADTAIRDFSVLFDSHLVSWEQVSLNLHGRQDNKTILIQNLKIDAPFIHAEGKGDLKSFELYGSANLQQAFHEIGKIFPIDWSGKGDASFHVTSKTNGDDHYTINTNIDIKDFYLAKSDKEVLPAHRLTIDGKINAPLSFFLKPDEAGAQLSIAVNTWPGTAILNSDNFTRKSGQNSGNYSLTTDLSLDRITSMLHAMEVLNPDLSIAGNSSIDSTGFFTPGKLFVQNLDSQLTGLQIQRGDTIFKDESILLTSKVSETYIGPAILVHPVIRQDSRLDTFQSSPFTGPFGSIIPLSKIKSHLIINFPENKLQIDDLFLYSKTASVKIDNLSIANWKSPLDSLTAALNVETELDELISALKIAGKFPTDIDVAGKAQLTVHAYDVARKGQNIGTNLYLENFSFSQKNIKIVDRENIHCNIQTLRNQRSDDLNIRNVYFKSNPLELSGVGHIIQAGDLQLLQLDGNYTPDLVRITPIIQALTGKEFFLNGKDAHDFSLTYPLKTAKSDQRNQHLKFNGSFSTDSFLFNGIELQQLRIPITVDRGNLDANISGKLNKGRLTILPHLFFDEKPAKITLIPKKQQILTNVQLQKPLVDGVLKQIHPIFGILTQPSGTITVQVDSLKWLVDKENHQGKQFTSFIDVSNATLDSSGLLKSILRNFNQEENSLQLKDTEIECIAKQGRIACSPVTITVADSNMVLSGSMGFDKSINYLLRIPVTKKLIGTEGYRVFKNTTLEIPITGTVNKPSYDVQALSNSLTDLFKQAAKNSIEKEINKALPKLFDALLKQ